MKKSETENGMMASGCYRSVQGLISEMMADSKIDRKEIAERMSARLGCRVSLNTLNDCASQSKPLVRFPAAWIEAFCEACGNDKLQRYVMGPRLRRLIEFAERELAAEKENRERQSLKHELLSE